MITRDERPSPPSPERLSNVPIRSAIEKILPPGIRINRS